MKKRILVFISALAMVLALCLPMTAWAADASVAFDKESYKQEENADINVGISIKADSNIGTYYVEVEYDNARMKYLEGGDEEKDGLVILTGTGISDQIEYTLTFGAIAGGEAGIAIKNAVINQAETDGGAGFTVKSAEITSITTLGDEKNQVSYADAKKLEEKIEKCQYPVLGIVTDNNDKPFIVVDLAKQVPDDVKWNYKKSEVNFKGQKLTALADQAENVKMIGLIDTDDNLSYYAVDAAENLYPVTEYKDGNNTYWYTSELSCKEVPEKIQARTDVADYIAYIINEKGEGDFGFISGDSANGGVIYYTEDEVKEESFIDRVLGISIQAKIIIGAVLLIVIINIIVISLGKKKKKNKARRSTPVKKTHTERHEAPAVKQDENNKVDVDELLSGFDVPVDIAEIAEAKPAAEVAPAVDSETAEAMPATETAAAVDFDDLSSFITNKDDDDFEDDYEDDTEIIAKKAPAKEDRPGQLSIDDLDMPDFMVKR